MIIRLSMKLASKIKAGKLDELPMDENPLADWSATIFTANRSQYILLCNTKTIYCCLMYGKGISNDCIFIERALSTIREFMEDHGNLGMYQQKIAPATASVRFAKALNRSVIGCMNDHVFGAKIFLDLELSNPDIASKLNETPMSSLIDAKGRKYASPKEAFKMLMESQGIH